MSEIQVITGDKSSHERPKSSLVIILDRLRSIHNVGNILRLADAVNAQKVICGGYTACPPHPKLSKSAMGAEEIVDTEHAENAWEAAKKLKHDGYQIIGIETVENATCIWDADLPEKTCFIFGNEALGLQEETLKVCDSFISLPAFGLKNSINVSNCASVVMFKYAELFSQTK